MKSTRTTALLTLAVALWSATTVSAATITSAGSGNWNSTTANAPWPGGTVPQLSDTVIIASGNTVTITDARIFTGPITVNGKLVKGSGANSTVFADITINSGGTLDSSVNGQAFNFGGNVTNNGSMTQSGGGSSFTNTFSGTGKIIAGTVSNGIANITGSYTNVGTFYIGVLGQSTSGATFSGAGTLVNWGTIVYNGAGWTAGSPVLISPGNVPGTFDWPGGNSVTVPAVSFYNLNLQAGGNTTLNASTISNNLSLIQISTWPSGTLTLGGLFWDATSASTSANGISMTEPFTLGGNGSAALTLTGVISDGGNGYSLTKLGSSSISLKPSAVESYAGNTVINGGTLTLDYSGFSGGQSNLVNSASSLQFGNNYLGGGTLIVSGKSGATDSQSFNGVTFNGGGNIISNNVVGTKTTIALGAIGARSAYGGNADFSSSGSVSTGPITTTTGNNAAGMLGGWATVLGSDWAMNDGNGNIVALSPYTGTLPTSGASASGNYTMGANITLSGSESANSLKITTANTLALGANNLTVGSVLTTVAGTATTSTSGGSIGAGAGNEFIVYTKAGSTFSIAINSTPAGLIGANSGGLTKSGPGTLQLNSGGSIKLPYTGPTVVHQGLLDCPGIIGFNSANIQVDAGATVTVRNVSITLTNQSLSGSGVFQGSSGGGALTIASNTFIYPGGQGTYGTLTLGGASGAGVTIQSGATLVFDLSKDPDFNTNLMVNVNAKNDQLVYNYNSAALTLPATLNVTIYQVDGVLGVGTYTLLASTGGQNFSQTPTVNVTWTGGSAPAAYAFAVVNNNRLVLNVTKTCAAPNLYTVGGGTGCTPSGVDVTLSSSDSGATYTLLTNAVSTGSILTGTGSALDFGTQTAAATYTVQAASPCGSTVLMSGSAIVNPAPNTSYSLTGGNGCSSPGVTIGLSGSDVGVTYTLLTNGVPTAVTRVGTGNPLSFSNQTAAAVYTVEGSIAGCSIATMAGSPSTVTITATPSAPTGVGAVASDSQVTVSWNAPFSGPAPTGYNVKRSTTSGSGYTTLAAGADVSGSPFVDSTAVNGTAYYYVVSSLNGSCESSNSAPEAAATPNPAFSAYIITGNGAPQAGTGDALTITTVDGTSTPVTGVSGNITLNFSGVANSPGGNTATINGSPITGPVTLNFSGGVASATLVAYNAGTATLSVSDGTHASTSAGGSNLGLVVSPASDSAYRISATVTNPVVGVADALIITLVDQYRNQSSFTGTKSLTFGGLSAAPDGSLPTVTDDNSNAVNFGTAATLHFTGGLADAGGVLVAYKVETGKLLTASDGTLTAAGTGGIAPTLSPTVSTATQLGITTQPSTTALAGVALTTQPVIQVLDQYANPTASNAQVTASASVGTLRGITTINASNGTASFSGLNLTNVGPVTLTFASTGLLSTNSATINVSGGLASGLKWVTQPGPLVYGQTNFTTAPVLEVVDQFGNPTTNGLPSSYLVNLSVAPGTGNGLLVGPTSYDVGAASITPGVATFNGLGYSSPVTGNSAVQLTASASGLYGAPIAGMALWLDANNASSVTLSNNGQVTAWNDLSGNGKNFATTLTGGTGIFYTNSNPTFSSRKTITFIGNELKNTSYTYSGNSLSVFVVFKKTTSGNGGGSYQRAAATWGGVNGVADYQSTASFNMDLGQNDNQTRVVRNEGSCGDLNGFSGDTSTNYIIDEFVATASQNAVFYNGIAGSTGGGCTGNFGIVATAVGGGLSGSGGANGPLYGDVAEVLIYNSALSTANRQAVETYLNHKWQSAAYPDFNLNSTPFTVSPATVTIASGVTANGKVYDGTSVATLSFSNVQLSGVLSADATNVTLDASSYVAMFANPGPGTAIPVSVTGLGLTGSAAPNYALVQPTGVSADITAVVLYSAYVLSAQNTNPVAGVDDQLTITAVDTNGVPVSLNGDVNLTFSGLNAAPDGSSATVNNKNGAGILLGGVTTLTFSNGVALAVNGAGTLVAHKAEPALLHVTDGTHSSTSIGGSGDLSLVILPGADTAYRISAVTNAPVAGIGDSLTINLVDPYQNLSSYTGAKAVTFGGLSAGPDGSPATINGTALGTLTSINFNSGSASASLVAHKAERGKLLTVTDGTLSATGPVGAAPTLSPSAGPAALLTIATQPSAVATAGVAFSSQPVLTILDQYGNLSASTAQVSASANAGNLQGTTTITSTSGTAAFTNLSLTTAGASTLTFSSSGLPSTNSSSINVSAGTAAALAWTTQPGSLIYGSTGFSPPPVVQTVDQYGNPSVSGLPPTATISIAVLSGTGTGSLLGTTNYNIGTTGSNGVVTFSGLGYSSQVPSNSAVQLSVSAQGPGSPPLGMAVWLDASASSSVVTSSGNVIAWNDLSGNGNNFLYGASGAFGANSVGYTNVSAPSGRRTVTFVGTGALTNASYNYTGSSWSAFIVVKSRVTGSAGNGGQYPAPLSGNDGIHNDYDWQLPTFYFELGQFNNDVYFLRGNGGTFGGEEYGAFNPSTNYNILDYFTATSPSSLHSLYVNGIRAAALQSAATGNFNLNVLTLGAQTLAGPSGSGYFDGDIAEVLIYNSDMSTSRGVIETYLSNKWQTATSAALQSAASSPFAVLALPVIISGSRTYDGTNDANADILIITNRVGNDDVILASGSAVLANKGIGSQPIVSDSSLALGGITFADYTLAGSTGMVSIITKALTCTGLTANNKCYDGTTAASFSGTASLLSPEDPGAGTNTDGQPYTGDDVSVTAVPIGTFAQSDVGNGISVTVSDLSLSGADSTNYSLNPVNGLSADIFALPATSTITGSNSVAANQPGVVYSVTSTPGSTYGWAVPPGAVITAGQGSSSITVAFGTNSGMVAVVETNGNGCAGSQVTLAVTVNAVNVQPANPVYGPVLSAGNFLVQFQGTPGITYTVEFAPALTGPWSKAGNFTAPTDNSQGYGVGVFQFTDPIFGGVTQRFYRTLYPSY